MKLRRSLLPSSNQRALNRLTRDTLNLERAPVRVEVQLVQSIKKKKTKPIGQTLGTIPAACPDFIELASGVENNIDSIVIESIDAGTDETVLILCLVGFQGGDFLSDSLDFEVEGLGLDWNYWERKTNIDSGIDNPFNVPYHTEYDFFLFIGTGIPSGVGSITIHTGDEGFATYPVIGYSLVQASGADTTDFATNSRQVDECADESFVDIILGFDPGFSVDSYFSVIIDNTSDDTFTIDQEPTAIGTKVVADSGNGVVTMQPIWYNSLLPLDNITPNNATRGSEGPPACPPYDWFVGIWNVGDSMPSQGQFLVLTMERATGSGAIPAPTGTNITATLVASTGTGINTAIAMYVISFDSPGATLDVSIYATEIGCKGVLVSRSLVDVLTNVYGDASPVAPPSGSYAISLSWSLPSGGLAIGGAGMVFTNDANINSTGEFDTSGPWTSAGFGSGFWDDSERTYYTKTATSVSGTGLTDGVHNGSFAIGVVVFTPVTHTTYEGPGSMVEATVALRCAT